jgi:CBS domain containing-hemolysin-like protein
MRNIDGIPDTTVANWVMESLGRLPHADEKITWNFLTIRVLRVLHNRVMEVKVNVDETKINIKGEEL